MDKRFGCEVPPPVKDGFWEEVARSPDLDAIERLRYRKALSSKQYQQRPQLKYERMTPTEGLPKDYVERVQTIEDVLQIGFALGVLKYEDIYGKRILDLGTGEGFGARVLKTYGGRVVGLDIEEDYLKGAIVFDNLKPDEVVKAKAMDYLATSPASFDVITGFQIMQRLYTGKLPSSSRPIRADDFNKFYDLCLYALAPNRLIILSYGWDIRPEIDLSKTEGVFAEGLEGFDSFVFFEKK
jgi:SAM-dependent methyltransferase